MEFTIFNRSWYNRAGVEKVMGFCSLDQYGEFMETVVEFERMIARSGIELIRYHLDISRDEQVMRSFAGRLSDTLEEIPELGQSFSIQPDGG
jgi:polyphosphate kinase 2 (PPK2 family)